MKNIGLREEQTLYTHTPKARSRGRAVPRFRDPISRKQGTTTESPHGTAEGYGEGVPAKD